VNMFLDIVKISEEAAPLNSIYQSAE
jgi:hypothetical protein